MKVLIIGNGGREHALAWKVAQSPKVSEVFVARGNAGMEAVATRVDIDPADTEALVNFAQEEGIDLTLVGPEDPLCGGIVDRFEAEDLKIFGPRKKCAQFEASKDFTKNFLTRHQVPTAAYETVTSYAEGKYAAEKMDLPLVIKADGLALGKGVVIAETLEEVEQTLDDMLNHDQFGSAGHKVVLEEFLEGDELSLLCMVSHNKLIPLEMARDYKKAEEDDRGLNTGGLGAYSPSKPLSKELEGNIDKILQKIENGLNEEKFDFTGILFIGLMVKDDQPKVLEFNVRFGDPETEVLLPRLKSDMVEIVLKALSGDLNAQDIQWSDQHTVGVILHSKGYPLAYEKKHPIVLPEQIATDQLLFHNGTEIVEGQIVNVGGRVLTAIGLGQDLHSARERAYALVAEISSDNLCYRRDIGQLY